MHDATFYEPASIRDHHAPILASVQFFNPNLEDVAPEVLQIEQVETELLPIVKQYRLIVLGGPPCDEKLLFAKHLAWHLSHSGGAENLPVYQWHPDPSLLDFPLALSTGKTGTILIFHGLKRHHVGFDLRQLLEQVASHSRYLIITTDSELTQWSSAPEVLERAIWRDALTIRISRRFLAGQLLERLQGERELPGDLKARLAQDSFNSESPLCAQHRVADIAERLRSPSHIRSFVLALGRQSEISDAKIEELISHVLDETHAIHRWFRDLGTRNQLMGLGMAFFDGLYDDQVFAGLELLVQEAWRDWEPLLQHFDYHELSQFSAHFEGTRESDKANCVACLSRQRRDAIFQVAWLLHRRRLVATLPALVKIIIQAPRWAADEAPSLTQKSSKDEAQNTGNTADSEGESGDVSEASRWLKQGRWRDLYGSPKRNGLLHSSIAGALSLLARMAPVAIEPTLIDLAKSERFGAQSVVAEALAYWRELDPGPVGDKRLFDLLKRWQEEAAIKEYLSAGPRVAGKPFSYVRATIALTLSRASLYDPPNQLNVQLVELFQRFIPDRSPLVRNRFRFETLPRLVAVHLKQLEGVLWGEVLPQQDLLLSTAIGLALAYRLRSAETAQVIQKWLDSISTIKEDEPNEERRIARVHTLTLVAHTYGFMEPGVGPGSLSAQEIFNFLGKLLAAEDHFLIRAAVLRAMIRQARADLVGAAPLVQRLVTELVLEERVIVVRFLTEIYLDQRAKLQRDISGQGMKPDLNESIDDVEYPIWLTTGRPQTSIEGILFNWLQDSSRSAAVQIAIEAFESFSMTKLEKRERELLREAEEAEKQQVANADPDSGSVPARSKSRELSFAGYASSFVAMPIDSVRRSILQAALPEILRRPAELPAGPDVTLAKLIPGNPKKEPEIGPESRPLLNRLDQAQDPFVQELARALTLAARIYMWRIPLACGAAIALLVVIGAIGALLN